MTLRAPLYTRITRTRDDRGVLDFVGFQFQQPDFLLPPLTNTVTPFDVILRKPDDKAFRFDPGGPNASQLTLLIAVATTGVILRVPLYTRIVRGRDDRWAWPQTPLNLQLFPPEGEVPTDKPFVNVLPETERPRETLAAHFQDFGSFNISLFPPVAGPEGGPWPSPEMPMVKRAVWDGLACNSNLIIFPPDPPVFSIRTWPQPVRAKRDPMAGMTVAMRMPEPEAPPEFGDLTRLLDQPNPLNAARQPAPQWMLNTANRANWFPEPEAEAPNLYLNHDFPNPQQVVRPSWMLNFNGRKLWFDRPILGISQNYAQPNPTDPVRRPPPVWMLNFTGRAKWLPDAIPELWLNHDFPNPLNPARLPPPPWMLNFTGQKTRALTVTTGTKTVAAAIRDQSVTIGAGEGVASNSVVETRIYYNLDNPGDAPGSRVYGDTVSVIVP